MSTLILNTGREKSLLRHHPWIFSGAIDRVDGDPAPGETVDVLSSRGDFLARAAYSPQSQIRARVWTFDPFESVDADFLHRRVHHAIASRASLLPGEEPGVSSAALRLIHAESDGLPGLIVDRYADTLVAQFLTAGADAWRATIADLLLELTGLKNLYERSDADVRELEGLPPRTGPLRGDPPLVSRIAEHGLQFKVDIAAGHKTGFYLDQRENRALVQQLAKDREVLDCFSYTGGFTINALAGGAISVLSIDSSAEVLALCRENVGLNWSEINSLESSVTGHPAAATRPPSAITPHTTLEGDVFQLLRTFRDQGRSFDMVILDPPKFAPTAAQAEKASRGYKDINLLAFKLLRPGGILVTFSCSGGVDAALFQKIVASAALDAGVVGQIIGYLSQAPDHPVALNFPEGMYLKGLVCLKVR